MGGSPDLLRPVVEAFEPLEARASPQADGVDAKSPTGGCDWNGHSLCPAPLPCEPRSYESSYPVAKTAEGLQILAIARHEREAVLPERERGAQVAGTGFAQG